MNVYSVQLYVINAQFSFISIGICSWAFALNLRGDPRLGLLSNSETARLLITLGDELNALCIKGCA